MSVNKVKNEIWIDDKLDRQTEAIDLLNFLKNASKQGNLRDDQQSYVMTVDADYGIGKSFFLKRLIAQAAEDGHAAAYIDAWSDDFQDDPFAAIISTLQQAFTAYHADDVNLQNKAKITWQKAVTAGGIILKGLAWRIGSIAVTGGALEGAEAVIKLDDNETKELQSEVRSLADNSASDLRNVSGEENSLLDRISLFNKSKQAIAELKVALQDTVNASPKKPVFIVIDELDRCRPDYAIKILEHIKHIFDIEGIVFLLGMNCSQIKHAITNQYGQGFDGERYLRRFFDRNYTLKTPRMRQLVEYYLSLRVIKYEQFVVPNFDLPPNWTKESTHAPEALHVQKIIAILVDYLEAFSVPPREVGNVIDALCIACYLAGGKKLFLPNLLIVIINSRIHPEVHPNSWSKLADSTGSLRYRSAAQNHNAPFSYNSITLKELFQGVNNYSSTLSHFPARNQIEEIRNLDLKDVPGDSPLLPHNYVNLARTVEQYTDKTTE